MGNRSRYTVDCGIAIIRQKAMWRIEMKQLIFLILASVMLTPMTALAQEGEDPIEQMENAERHMQLRRMQLELERAESDLEFHRQSQELELQQHRAKLKLMQKPARHGKVKAAKDNGEGMPLLILLAVVHILTAVWVYQDIRRRNSGSGLWIVIAVLTGLLGTLVYAVVRIGDVGQRQGKNQTAA